MRVKKVQNLTILKVTFFKEFFRVHDLIGPSRYQISCFIHWKVAHTKSCLTKEKKVLTVNAPFSSFSSSAQTIAMKATTRETVRKTFMLNWLRFLR